LRLLSPSSAARMPCSSVAICSESLIVCALALFVLRRLLVARLRPCVQRSLQAPTCVADHVQSTTRFRPAFRSTDMLLRRSARLVATDTTRGKS
jgi:hypothetical protein